MGLFSRPANAPAKPAEPLKDPSIPAVPVPDWTDIARPPAALMQPPATASQPVLAPIAPKPSPAPVIQAPPTERQLYFQRTKVRVHQQLVERLDVQNMRSLPAESIRGEVRTLIKSICQ